MCGGKTIQANGKKREQLQAECQPGVSEQFRMVQCPGNCMCVNGKGKNSSRLSEKGLETSSFSLREETGVGRCKQRITQCALNRTDDSNR